RTDDLGPDTVDDVGGDQVREGRVRIGDALVGLELETILRDAREAVAQAALEIVDGGSVAAEGGKETVHLGGVSADIADEESAAAKVPVPGLIVATLATEEVGDEAIEAEGRV